MATWKRLRSWFRSRDDFHYLLPEHFEVFVSPMVHLDRVDRGSKPLRAGDRRLRTFTELQLVSKDDLRRDLWIADFLKVRRR
jgi:hypothetical protein